MITDVFGRVLRTDMNIIYNRQEANIHRHVHIYVYITFMLDLLYCFIVI